MYFGFGPFGLGFSNLNPNQQPRQQFFNHQQQQQQPGFIPNINPFNNQYHPPPPPPQQNNNGGFFNTFTNFMNENFMNPFSNNSQNRQNQQPRQEQARPSFFRKSSKQEKKPDTPPKKQKYSQNTGIYWKIKGNEAFQSGKYELAIQFYSKAIELNNSESVFYSNRAQCYKRLGKIEQALRDAQQSVELDPSNIRGHMISGQILAQTGKIQDNIHKVQNSITRLTKALTLSGGKKLQLQKQISRLIYLAKKVLFYLRFNLVRNTRIRAINQYKEYLANDDKLDADTKERKMQQFLDASNQRVVFSIPEYLQCRITLELMEDPVITDSGQTYERSAIEQHIQRNGKTDPFTRQPIKGPLYPSISIKKAIEDFLQHNPWAYQYIEGQNYKDISF